jgi:hypothetical protein
MANELRITTGLILANKKSNFAVEQSRVAQTQTTDDFLLETDPVSSSEGTFDISALNASGWLWMRNQADPAIGKTILWGTSTGVYPFEIPPGTSVVVKLAATIEIIYHKVASGTSKLQYAAADA